MTATLLYACKTENNKQTTEQTSEVVEETIAYASYGDSITPNNAIKVEEMYANYKSMGIGDTTQVKYTAIVEEVCQSKGCWMKLRLEDGTQAMVKFKDYAFFMPKDIAGKEVIVDGKAFVEEMSVEDQRHFAEDAGKSAEEIAAITLPKKTYSIEAAGVLIKQ